MGLDIVYYKNIEKFEGKAEINEHGKISWEWMQDNKLVRLNPFSHIERADGLIGIYSFEDCGGFRAGGYSGYNRYRELLATTLLKLTGVENDFKQKVRKDKYASNKIWKHKQEFKGQPFFEQIHFSDCEGVIGPETSAKLAKDYNKFESEFQKTVKNLCDGEYAEKLIEKYSKWKNAFNQVAGNGAIEFR